MVMIFLFYFGSLLALCAAASEDILKVQYPLFGICQTATYSKITNNTCSSHLKALCFGLKKRETWALYMLDSSGAPESGFIRGNNYWLGSRSQCHWRSIEHSVLPLKETTFKSLKYPPFEVNFYIGCFSLNSSLQSQTNPSNKNFIVIGFCLPSSCTIQELKPLLQSWTIQNPLAMQHLYDFDLKLIKIRKLIKESYFENNWILVVVSSFVIVTALFVLLGTLYDIYAWTPERKRYNLMKLQSRSKKWEIGKMRNIRDIDEALNHDNNLNDCYELKIDNSLHKSIPVPITILHHENRTTDRSCKSTVGKFIICFSAVTNAKEISGANYDKRGVPAVHGLTFLGTIWIIYLFTIDYLKDIAGNGPRFLSAFHGVSWHEVSTSTFSVDTFFFASGFLLSYTYHRNHGGSSRCNNSFSIKTKVNEFFVMILKRFIRVSPIYIFTLGIAVINNRRNSRINTFGTTELSQNACEQYWWRNLLYINNLFKAEEMCMTWSWYLSTEMQFFILGAALLIISLRFWKFTAWLTGSLIVISSLLNGYLSYGYNFNRFNREQSISIGITLPYLPWLTVGPYLIGLYTGYFTLNLKREFKLNKVTLVTCWVVGLMSGFWALFGFYSEDMSIISIALYNALSRPAWGVGLSWIVIACATGNADIVNALLSFHLWIPLSKLSLTAYLISPLIVNLVYSSSEIPFNINLFPLLIFVFGFVGTVYLCAWFLSITLELPYTRVGKQLIGRKHVLNQLSRY